MATPTSALRRRPSGLTAIAAAITAVLVVPLGAVLVQAVAAGSAQARRLARRPILPELATHTVQLAVLVSVGCAVVGVGSAWCVERTDLVGRAVWRVLLVLPLAVPEFVAGFGWVSLFPAVHGLWGAALVMTFSLYPWVFLPVAAGLRNADGGADDVARSLGLGPLRRFTRVTLPTIRLPLAGGILIVGLYLLAEYGAFAALRFPTFATAIFREYSLSFNAGAASLLTLALCTLGLAFLAAEYVVLGRTRSIRASAAATTPAAPMPLGALAPVVAIGLLGVVALGLGVPIWSIVTWAVRDRATTLPPGSIVAATGRSLWLGAIAAMITTSLALPVALMTVRHPGRLAQVIERSIYLVRALPGVAVGLTFVTVAVHHVRIVYQSTLLLEAAYVVLFFPLALVAVRSAIVRVPPGVEDVARSLGLRSHQVLLRVTGPLIAPGLGAALTLVWLSATTELTATLLLRPTGLATLATRYWGYTSGLAYSAAAPYAAVMILVSAIPTALLVRLGTAQPAGR